jgi:hypothetical protein
MVSKGPRSITLKGTKQKAMLKALEKTLGIVSEASKLANIDRVTHYRWMDQDDKYAKKVTELKNVALDFAESKLKQKIKEGDTRALIFYLSRQGKERGYSKQPEVQVNVQNNNGVIYQLKRLQDDYDNEIKKLKGEEE